MRELSQMVSMGHVAKPHGIKGELALRWHGNFIPENGDTIFLGRPGEEPTAFLLLSSRWHKERLLVTLANVKDRTAAENLVGADVLINRASLPPLEEDEFYLEDLLGCEVYTDDGNKIGILDHLEFPAEQEIWVIMQPNGKEVLFPAQEEFISEIDAANRKIVIQPPPGLLEVYRA